jgi:hypothetical protein
MKTLAKFAIASLALAGSSAFAAIDLPSTGNGELVLLVRDLSDSTRQVVLETNVRLNDILTQAQIVGSAAPSANGVPVSFTYNFTDVTSTALATFLSAPSASGYEYMLFAGDSASTRALGDARFLSTSNFQYTASTPSPVTNNNIGNTGGIGITSENQLVLVDASLVEAGNTGFAAFAQDQENFFFSDITSVGIAQPGTLVGTATNLYVFTTAGGTSSARARVYQGNDVVLNSNGTLSVVGGAPPPVPLPAAVWLLGSALAGFGAISRRRGKTAA